LKALNIGQQSKKREPLGKINTKLISKEYLPFQEHFLIVDG